MQDRRARMKSSDRLTLDADRRRRSAPCATSCTTCLLFSLLPGLPSVPWSAGCAPSGCLVAMSGAAGEIVLSRGAATVISIGISSLGAADCEMISGYEGEGEGGVCARRSGGFCGGLFDRLLSPAARVCSSRGSRETGDPSGLLRLGRARPIKRVGMRYLIEMSMLAPSAARVTSGGCGTGGCCVGMEPDMVELAPGG